MMLLIPLIPIAALVTQNMIILNNIIVRKADLQDSDLSVVKSDEQVNIYHYFGIDNRYLHLLIRSLMQFFCKRN